MYIDRRYRPRRRRSAWTIILALLIVATAAYLVATRTRFIQNPFNPLAPTPTPTRSAVSYLAEAEDLYGAGRLAAATAAYTARPRWSRRTMRRWAGLPGCKFRSGIRLVPSKPRARP